MKRKVNIDRPKISSEEISQRKNFDSVLKNNASMSGKSLFKKPWFLSGVVATVAIIVTAVFLTQDSRLKTQDPATNTQQLTIISDSLALAEFYKAEEAKPCISPPLEGCNVPYTIYKVNAEKGAELDFKTGSKMSIPKNAFADDNGKPLKGEVELRYREFHDAVDFFVAGIPMTYDSAGTRYHFESAGMIEMLAYQNGKQVKMAPGKSVNIELASNYRGTEYNLYELDTLQNNWACLGKDKVILPKKQSKEVESIEGDFESAPIVQQAPEYKTIETKKVEAQKEKEIKIDALPKLAAKPKEPNLAKKGKYTFNLEVDPKEYPELAVYKGLLFEVGDENKNFNKAMYDITWDEAIVKDGNKKGENYLLTLKKASKKYDLIVYPVLEGKNYETALKDFQNKFTQYNIALDKRKAQEKQIEIEYQTKLAQLEKEQREIERKWKEEQDNAFRSMETQEKVKRVFTINRFGVFNCDNPVAYPKGVLCNAQLTNDKFVKLMCYDIYLVDKAKNGLFTYNKNPIVRFSFDPKSKNMLWTVEHGVLYILKPEQFANISGNNNISTLQMNRVDQKFKTAEEMKAYLNF
ncbi:MAG: hypothetical protein ACT4ON_00335 [Bacteroidota bacterium]